MAFVTLVRHGQANSAARTEDGYDQLSALGQRQAHWLGAHFRDTGEVFARAYSGTLIRQRETLKAIKPYCATPPVVDERFNELPYFTLAQALLDQHGVPMPTDREGFAEHLPRLFSAWQRGAIEGAPETFAAFEARVREVIHEVADGTGRALVVTSGGLIGMAMRLVLDLDIGAMAKICLSIENSSVHRLQRLGGGLFMTQFNAIPHLDIPDRAQARSHV